MTNNDELRAHIAGLLNSLYGYLSMNDVLQQRAAHLGKSTFAPADLRRRASAYGPILQAVTANWYEPLTEHASKILKLTEDTHLRVLVRQVERLARGEVEDRNRIIAQSEETSVASDSIKLVGKVAVTAVGMTARRIRIKTAMNELQKFYGSAA